MYKYLYKSPIGDLIFISDGTYLTKIILKNELTNDNYQNNSNLKIFKLCQKYFDKYFNNQIPNIKIPIKLEGTKFQKAIWTILEEIPYGHSTTYKGIASLYLQKYHLPNISYQAIGHAISNNPILIYLPCHRILGQKSKLTGFRVGIEIKKQLLDIEHIKYQE